MKYTLIFLTALILAGCSSSPISTEKDLFFSISDYFKAEIQRLENEKPQIAKKITKDGIEESIQTIKSWDKELKVFIKSDINKAAWRDLYSVDTVIDSGSKTITYVSTDKSIQVKKVVVKFSKSEVKSITIQSSEKNPLYDSSTDLFYAADSFYTVRNKQKVRLIGKTEFFVETQFFSN
ncbi:MAG: hypothetical protein ACJAZ3_000850 [Sphingobacteriales bacterium]|jgi:hypothetical protein